MRALLWAGAMTALAFGSACGSTVNQDACKLYVEHLNGLDCTADVESDDVCPPSLDEGGGGKCDAFYACLTESSTCDGDTFVSGVETCTSCEVRS